jgi:hypothetical protein
LSYSPQDINCGNYTYDFNTTVDNGQAIKVSNKRSVPISHAVLPSRAATRLLVITLKAFI